MAKNKYQGKKDDADRFIIKTFIINAAFIILFLVVLLVIEWLLML